MSPTAGTATPNRMVDGRSAIRDRNRLAVLDAVLDLFSEGNLSPGPEEVALRAGLSTRSVYRYFDDRDALSRAAIGRQLDTIVPLARIPAIGQGDLNGRIGQFVSTRLRLHGAASATARAARIRATFDEVVRAQLDRSRRALRHQVGLQFAPELARFDTVRRESRLAAVDTLFQFESLDRYRMRPAAPESTTEALLVDALTALITPDPVGSRPGPSPDPPGAAAPGTATDEQPQRGHPA
jgi:AcrR family transcriptional regulator